MGFLVFFQTVAHYTSHENEGQGAGALLRQPQATHISKVPPNILIQRSEELGHFQPNILLTQEGYLPGGSPLICMVVDEIVWILKHSSQEKYNLESIQKIEKNTVFRIFTLLYHNVEKASFQK